MPCAEGGQSSSEYQGVNGGKPEHCGARPDKRAQAADADKSIAKPHSSGEGMLHEAYHIGDKFTIEMSHHYGLEQFRANGALIVNLVNREYCKKLIIMLRGQRHPNHRHGKRGTFNFCAALKVNLNGVQHELSPGKFSSWSAEHGTASAPKLDVSLRKYQRRTSLVTLL